MRGLMSGNGWVEFKIWSWRETNPDFRPLLSVCEHYSVIKLIEPSIKWLCGARHGRGCPPTMVLFEISVKASSITANYRR